MKHRLSFGYFNILAENILEVIVDDGVELTLEMLEESHQFVDDHFSCEFAMLVNKVNNYSYSYEAQLSLGSYAGLKAIAFVCFSSDDSENIAKLLKMRAIDALNAQLFSGLELGWQQAFSWLQKELTTLAVS